MSIGEPALVSVQFRFDQASGKMVLRVVDRLSGEVVRQVPPEEALKIAAYIRAYLQGLAARDSSALEESR